jgi:hypothetical protein
MALGLDRTRLFVKGLSNFEIRETSPSAAAAFSSAGALGETTLTDDYRMVEVFDSAGDYIDTLPGGRSVTGSTNFLQSTKDELDIARTADGKEHAVRFHGLCDTGFWQYYSFPQCRILPALNLAFQSETLRVIPASWAALKQAALTFDLDEYFVAERTSLINTGGLQLWVDARDGLNSETANLVDISGFENHGTVTSDFAAIWDTAAAPFNLNFDGTDDAVDFGDVLNFDADDDGLFEVWFRTTAADASVQEILSKKAGTANEDGYSIHRDVSNKAEFKLSDGAASGTVTTSTSCLQDVWHLFSVTLDKSGNLTPYLDGVADGTPAAAPSGDSTTATNLYLGRLGSAYGGVDVGGVRIYKWDADGLPSDVATWPLAHYNAEKSYYGL